MTSSSTSRATNLPKVACSSHSNQILCSIETEIKFFQSQMERYARFKRLNSWQNKWLRLILSRDFFAVFASVFRSVFCCDVMTRQQKIRKANTVENLLDSEQKTRRFSAVFWLRISHPPQQSNHTIHHEQPWHDPTPPLPPPASILPDATTLSRAAATASVAAPPCSCH